MSNQTFVSKQEPARHDVRIKVLLNKLRSKLKNLAVMDQQGLLVGEVKDVGLDVDRQLNLLVSQLNADQNESLVLIRSKQIQQIDPSTQALFVNLTKAEIQQLPKYVKSEKASAQVEIPAVSVQPTHEVTDPFGTQAPDSSDESFMSTSTQLQDHQQDAIPEDGGAINSPGSADVVEEEIIRLLGERVIVDTVKHKVGEVIVRKEIETRMVQVPVRREVLIVEQVGPEYKQLATIDLGGEEIAASQPVETVSLQDQLSVKGEFHSPKTAAHILDAIAHQRRSGCVKVRVEVILEDTEHLKTYQEWFDRCSIKPQTPSNS